MTMNHILGLFERVFFLRFLQQKQQKLNHSSRIRIDKYYKFQFRLFLDARLLNFNDDALVALILYYGSITCTFLRVRSLLQN